MIAYIERKSAQVWELLRDGNDAFIDDSSVGPVVAADIANAIHCHVAYRHERGAFEFAIHELAAQHPLDLLLIDDSWRHGE